MQNHVVCKNKWEILLFLIIKINSINIVQIYANVFKIINILINIQESAIKTTRMNNPKLKSIVNNSHLNGLSLCFFLIIKNKTVINIPKRAKGYSLLFSRLVVIYLLSNYF